MVPSDDQVSVPVFALLPWNLQLGSEIVGLNKFAAYFTGARTKFKRLMIVILFSFLAYTTFDMVLIPREFLNGFVSDDIRAIRSFR